MEAQRLPRQGAVAVSAKEQKEMWNHSIDATTQSRMKHMLEAGHTAADLSEVLGEMPTSLPMMPAMANLPTGHSVLRSNTDLLSGACQVPAIQSERSWRATLSAQRCSTRELDEAEFDLTETAKALLIKINTYGDGVARRGYASNLIGFVTSRKRRHSGQKFDKHTARRPHVDRGSVAFVDPEQYLRGAIPSRCDACGMDPFGCFASTI